MQYRHEWKIEINTMDRLILRQRLQAVMQRDSHAFGETYAIRSLYFDTLGDKALHEKQDGVNIREKFRIRLYNGDLSFIRLEKKMKVNGLCAKQTAVLTAEEAQKIVDGDVDWMLESGRPLVMELYSKMQCGLRPKTIVDYTREPFVYAPGNVRVAMDYEIRTGLQTTAFLDPNTSTVPAGDPITILEVKWDAFLPDIIRDAVELSGRHSTAFSKYEQCRIYG